MRLRFCAHTVLGVACLVASIGVAITGATAAPADYRFELVQAQPAGPGKTTVTVSLVHVPDNKPVAGAVLFESKTDMGPDGMAGKWALNLGGKVQGEAGTVRGTVTFTAAK